jgi:hypothetical protein
MWREDGTGEGGRVEGDAGASFGGSAAQLGREGAYGTAGVCARCPDPSKESSARVLSDAGMGKREPALVLASDSL